MNSELMLRISLQIPPFPCGFLWPLEKVLTHMSWLEVWAGIGLRGVS